jgi:hypothetical protein
MMEETEGSWLANKEDVAGRWREGGQREEDDGSVSWGETGWGGKQRQL